MQLPRGVILFSCGKDSIVLTHIAMKSFYPLEVPFDLLHIDTDTIFKRLFNLEIDLSQNTTLI